MSNKVIGVILGAAIMIIISASVMMPIINDASYEISNKENNTTMFYSALKDYGEELVITPTGEGLVIDGESYATARITSDNYFVSYYPHTTWYECDLYSIELGTLQGVDLITLHKNGTITVNVDGTDYTTTIVPKFTFVTDKDGDWGEFRNSSLSVTYGQKTYACHYTNFGTPDAPNIVFWSGEFVNGVAKSVSAVSYNGSDPSLNAPLDNFSVQDENLSKEKGHYNMHSSVRLQLGDSTLQDEFAYVFAPIEYAAPTEIQNSAISLINVVPIFVIVAILLSCIVLFRRY